MAQSVLENDLPTEPKLEYPRAESVRGLAAIVIPATMNSQRISCKPSVWVEGKPLIAYAVRNALLCERACDVGVVTNSDYVRDVVATAFRGKTLPIHSTRFAESGSQRVGFWLDEFEAWDTYDIVVNLSCGEPCVDPRDLDNLIAACNVSDDICTLVTALPKEQQRDQNVVKAWLRGATIRDFSRSLLHKYPAAAVRWHVAAYAVPRRWFHACFTGYNHAISQRAKSMGLEQIAWVDADIKLRAVELKHSDNYFAINTPKDYDRFCRRIAHEQDCRK